MDRRRIFLLCVALPLLASNLTFADSVAETQREYFPKGVFSDYSNTENLLRNWYSEQLRALEEPSLYPPKLDADVYRFTWLRTFHNPMVFRLDVLENGAGILTVKRANGAGGYQPGIVDLRKEIPITKEQIDGLKKRLDAMSYWEKPAELKEMLGTDGAQWIVEANAGGKYKIVDRWSESDSEIHAWGLELITLSGIEVGDIY
jgi:hypothetical protein